MEETGRLTFEAYAQTPGPVLESGASAGLSEPDTLGEALQADPGFVLDKIET